MTQIFEGAKYATNLLMNIVKLLCEKQSKSNFYKYLSLATVRKMFYSKTGYLYQFSDNKETLPNISDWKKKSCISFQLSSKLGKIDVVANGVSNDRKD